jgi:hypothetical protein
MPRAAMSVATSTRQLRRRGTVQRRSRAPCDLLPWIACAVMPAFSRRLRDAVGAVLGAREHQRALELGSAAALASRSRFLAFATRSRRSARCGRRSRPAASPRRAPDRAGMLRRQRGDVLRHRRREQQRLALLRHVARMRLHVGQEAHVEHAVGLVEHEDLDLVRGSQWRCWIRSSRRPGVATRMSTPRAQRLHLRRSGRRRRTRRRRAGRRWRP